MKPHRTARAVGAVALTVGLLSTACATNDRSHLSSTVEPASTRPPATSAAPGPGWEQRQGQAALALITEYPWRDLAWRITFDGGREGIIAETRPGAKRIRVHVRRSMGLEELAHALAHEIGHAHDLTHLDDECRASYKAARGVAGRSGWLDWQGRTDYGLPGGDYAEVFALWAMDGVGPFKGTMAPRPSASELESLGRFFSPAGCHGPR